MIGTDLGQWDGKTQTFFLQIKVTFSKEKKRRDICEKKIYTYRKPTFPLSFFQELTTLVIVPVPFFTFFLYCTFKSTISLPSLPFLSQRERDNKCTKCIMIFIYLLFSLIMGGLGGI